MNISVKGVKVKLLDLSMIRRYNETTPLLDPAVADILVNKGYAIFLNDNKENKKEEIKVEDEEDELLFSKEIINEV
jgi:hypothetical protein